MTFASGPARLLAGAVVLLAAERPGLAHHGGAVARVEPARPGGQTTGREGAWLSTTLGYGYTRFGRVLEGQGRLPNAEASIEVHLAELGVRLGLPTRTQLAVLIPAGLTRIASEDGTREAAGLGDLRLEVEQSVLRPFIPNPPLGFDLRFLAGVSVPSGRYGPDDRVRFQELETGPGGELDLVPYDTRTSLGAGTATVRVGTALSARPHPLLRLTLSGTFGTPLGATEDDIRWGDDLELRAYAAGTLGPVLLGTGVAWRHHGADGVPAEDGRRASVGGRDVVGALGHAALEPIEGYSVGIDVHVPFYQDVRAVQVAESFSGSVWLRGTFSLGPAAGPEEEK